jgi:hypothetical protein
MGYIVSLPDILRSLCVDSERNVLKKSCVSRYSECISS